MKPSEINNRNKEWNIIPIPGAGYTEDTGFLMALALTGFSKADPENPESKNDSFSAAVMYSFENMFRLSLSGSKYLKDESRNLSASLSFAHSVDDFYGTGINTSDSSKENYEINLIDFKISYLYDLGGNFYAGPELMFYQDKLNNRGNLLSTEDIYGKSGICQAGGGISLIYDSRDSTTYPASGFYSSFSWTAYNSNIISDYSYTHFKTDIRAYVELFNQNIIGVNSVLETTVGDVPFQMMPELGGSSILRGFESARYRDKNFTAVQIEYRFPLAGPLGAVLFSGAGTVADDFSTYKFDDIKYASGGGLRFNLSKDQHINLRLDYALNSDNESAFIFTVMEAF